MNQAIQFVDRYRYNLEKQAIEFDAIVSGMIVLCYYPHIKDGIELFIEHNKFDLEELATVQIEDEAYNKLGEIWLKTF